MERWLVLAVLLSIVSNWCEGASIRGAGLWDPAIRMPSEKEVWEEESEDEIGTRWGVLVAGSMGFGNYRHQADVCHAYQLLKNGGLKDENIVVFMYDDIATSPLNPRPGIIINHPEGEDVYAGVPKDYTGKNVTVQNLFSVLLGDESAVQGGSGKVIDSKADDHIFIYYSDHGGPGVLGMPNMPYLYAGDFIEVLKKKHAANSYKKMVIYVEACESGSMFQGMMPENLNIYVTTASNAVESSWGTYCPGMQPPPPPEFLTCLGDLYSIAWMEDSETHNLKEETIKKQYESVKERTSSLNSNAGGSHVMEYGDTSFKDEKLYLYQGFDPSNAKQSLTFHARSRPPRIVNWPSPNAKPAMATRFSRSGALASALRPTKTSATCRNAQTLRCLSTTNSRYVAVGQESKNMRTAPRDQAPGALKAPIVNPADKYQSKAENLHRYGAWLMGCLPKYIQQFSLWKDELTIYTAPSGIIPVMQFLKYNTAAEFTQVSTVTCADYPTRDNRFEIVYNLLSVRHNSRIRVKTYADEASPVPSITGLFGGANWYEREVYDLYGVFFVGHPDLRRIMTDYGFEGHPLRKDFPLTGYTEVRYDEEKKRIVTEPLELTQAFRNFEGGSSAWEQIGPGEERTPETFKLPTAKPEEKTEEKK